MKRILVVVVILLLCCCVKKVEKKIISPQPKVIVKEKVVDYREIFKSIDSSRTGLSEKSFMYAYRGYIKLKQSNQLNNIKYLTICDFTKSTAVPRMYVINMKKRTIEVHTWVSHGGRSGNLFPTKFSNINDSHKSSIGFFITSYNSYMGKNGTSLRLKGLEYTNNNAYNRAIVVHGSYYTGRGKSGHSFGCPAVPMKIVKSTISYIKGGSCFFIYYPSDEYLKKSKLLQISI